MKEILVAMFLIPCILIGQPSLPRSESFIRKVEALSEQELIKLLSNEDQNLRIAAAIRIADLISNRKNVVDEGNVVENELEHWKSKSLVSFYKKYDSMADGKIRINYTSQSQFLKDFDLNESDFTSTTYKNIGFIRLDNLYQVRFRKVVTKLDLISIVESPLYYNVLPKNSFDGDWFTFYINGKIYSKSSYDTGVKIAEEIYSNSEKVLYRKYYDKGICYKIEFCSPNGTIDRVHYEVLSEEEANIVCTLNFVY